MTINHLNFALAVIVVFLLSLATFAWPLGFPKILFGIFWLPIVGWPAVKSVHNWMNRQS